MKMRLLYHIFCLTLLWTLVMSCDRGGAPKSRLDRLMDSDSIPATVKQLVRSVADGDSIQFARLVSYPLKRPYPLHDIENADQMAHYYREMVDDSLRNAILESSPEDWGEYGWRGWSVRDGGYVWIDSIVYQVPYISQTERHHLDELRKREIASLAKTLQGDWNPIATLVDPQGKVLRIDARHVPDLSEPGSIRLLVYDSVKNLTGTPARELQGVLDTEGSSPSDTYLFDDASGVSYMIDTDPADDDSPHLITETPDGITKTVPLKVAYWLDLINKKQSKK